MCPPEGSLLIWVCQRSNMCYETTIFAVLIVEWHLIWTIPAHQLLILFDNKTHCFAHYRLHHHTHYCLNNINQMLILKLFTFHLHFILCMPDGAYRCISCHTGVALLVCWIVKRNYTHTGSGRQAVVPRRSWSCHFSGLYLCVATFLCESPPRHIRWLPPNRGGQLYGFGVSRLSCQLATDACIRSLTGFCYQCLDPMASCSDDAISFGIGNFNCFCSEDKHSENICNIFRWITTWDMSCILSLPPFPPRVINILSQWW